MAMMGMTLGFAGVILIFSQDSTKLGLTHQLSLFAWLIPFSLAAVVPAITDRIPRLVVGVVAYVFGAAFFVFSSGILHNN